MTLLPLDDLWPHPPMHHLCSYIQGSLPPSLIKVDGIVYKWAAILQTLTKMSHAYVQYTEIVITYSLPEHVQARPKKKCVKK